MLVIHNARIHTLNPVQPFVTALAIDQGKILAAGSDAEILAGFSKAKCFDAAGRSIIPGLTDAHIHLEDFALSLLKIDCETPTRQECLRRVAERVKTSQPGEWILGHGWNQNDWVDGYGTAAQLDEIAPYNPVYLTHKSLHSAWANSDALRLAGITVNTPDPPGGRLGRLPGGEPDGILIESASKLLERAIPEPNLEQLVRALQQAIRVLWRMGLTGVHDFSPLGLFSALQTLHNKHELQFRVLKGIPREKLSWAINEGFYSGSGDDMLCIGPVKLFSDGALGSRTAAMFQPYEGEPANTGILMMDANAIYELGQDATRHDINLAVHAIGDRANHEVLTAFSHLRKFEQSLGRKNQFERRHRIEHVQLIRAEDARLFAELGIIASMQPIHAPSDMLMADRYWGSRSAYAYAWRNIVYGGATIAFGSDAPVESPNPFWGIHAAVTRRRRDGSPSADGWYPEQRLSIIEAIQGYTSGAAFAAGMDDRSGKLSPGFLADLLVLDIDPYNASPEELPDIKPLATMVGGEWVYLAEK